MDIFAQIKKLDLPRDEYVVVGSGPLGVRGLREIHDIDIVAVPELFEQCKKDGTWTQVPWDYNKLGQIFLRRDIVELYLDVNCGEFNPTTSELMNRADVIQGVRFASLHDTVSFKRAYNTPKHSSDIRLIEDYLARRHRPGDL